MIPRLPNAAEQILIDLQGRLQFVSPAYLPTSSYSCLQFLATAPSKWTQPDLPMHQIPVSNLMSVVICLQPISLAPTSRSLGYLTATSYRVFFGMACTILRGLTLVPLSSPAPLLRVLTSRRVAVRALSFRFEAFGRPVSSTKKWEEGVFSDLRNLKPGTDASLEEPK